jgi:D-amino-acid dehydrogenase
VAGTVIVGGGVIGLACAWELRRRGEDVLILDRNEPGAACSAGNAGWITPSISTPLPAPGLVGTSMRWMMKRDSPLYIKPRLDPRFAGWLVGFWRNCRPDVYVRGLEALSALNQRTMPLFDRWQEDGIDFEMHKAGLLFLGLSREAITHTATEIEQLERFGYRRPSILSGAEVRELEPGLSDSVAGGFHVEEERHVRPETLTSGLVQRLKDDGVEIRTGVEVTGIARRSGTVNAVMTNVGSVAAERVLIAAGSWTGQIAQRFGFKLPIEAGKGYSVTIEHPRRTITRPLDLIEARVAVTPFSDGLRLAGTMELSGLNLRLEPSRVEAIRRAGDQSLGDWRGGRHEKVWVGMRPLTPDGLPVIGQVAGCDNLYVAGGHQMLGITLAPATGEAVAELMLSGTSQVDLRPFDPARFTGAALSASEPIAVPAS